MPTCCGCQKDLAKAAFSKNQLRKDPNSKRCKACVKLMTAGTSTGNSTAGVVAPLVPEKIQSTVQTPTPESVSATETTPVPVPETEAPKQTSVVTEPPTDVDEKNKAEISSLEVEQEGSKKKEEILETDAAAAAAPDQPTVDEPVPEPELATSTETADQKSVTEVTEAKIIDEHVDSAIILEQLSSDEIDKHSSSATAITSNAKRDEMDEKKETEGFGVGGSTILNEIDNMNMPIPDESMVTKIVKVVFPTDAKVDVVAQIMKEVPGKVMLDHNKETESVGDLSTRTSNHRIQVGICAMDKKARSKPMGEILTRLDEGLFEIIFFGDDTILNQPVEDWPICDVLIAFFSNGYPLEKVEEYAELRKPFLLNDLKMQRVLKDRRRVYDLLKASGIDVPKHVYMNRDGYETNTKDTGEHVDDPDGSDDEQESSELVEFDDHIEVDGVSIHKPFVEKPVDADDHNIAIYYPSSAGGGCKKLFRKIGDRSSEFYPDINEIRREGSYIYEEFVETQGTDVKMYTVGPDYGHAEARKSPTVDGRVERGVDGKEVRFPVILTLQEKEIARRIVVVFKQLVCGFDLLRVQEADSLVSYVCDVNGWSFVKSSRKYYDDCAQLLTEHMLAAVKPKALIGFSALDPLLTTMKDFVQTPRRRRQHKPVSRKVSVSLESCPASPMKDSDMIKDDASYLSNQSAAATLEDGAKPVREMPDMLMKNPIASAHSSVNGDDDTQTSTNTDMTVANGTHQEELRCVITVVRHGDRTPKQKLKVNMSEPLLLKYFHKHSKNCKKDLKIKDKKPMREFLTTVLATIAEKEATLDRRALKSDKILYKLRHMRDVLERWKIGGLNRKLQMKPRKWDESVDQQGKKILRCSELQLILKWGGNLTKLGEKQAVRLGERLRDNMYPNTPGGGILRLHSTFRHDMKIKTSDEGRVMKTAAAFAKGLLELEGSIPPILVSLVHKEKHSMHMLDPSGNKEVKEELEACKLEVNEQMQKSFNVANATEEQLEAAVGPKELVSMRNALIAVGNPQNKLFAIHNKIGELLVQLDDMLGIMASDVEVKHEGGEGLKGGEDEEDEALCGIKLYKGETLLELTERWRILYIKFYEEDEDKFDLSRVPDVHDNVRFDMLHNPHLGLTSTLEELYNMAKDMADCIVPQEYGTTIKEKRRIGSKMCGALLEKIKYDLIIARTDNQVDMRYMINQDYSADLPINTMGRRIRTRLYFTSESHLHTLLNVLRFPSEAKGAMKSPLSKRGVDIISSAPELCYLTQVAIRLFENTSIDVNNPRRFRIEILFSSGATATPLHMSELQRDQDASRFDTEPLQLISSDYLTCKEVEDYFNESIKEGATEEEDDPSAMTSCEEGKPDESETKVSKADLNDMVPSPKASAKSVIIAEDKNLEIGPELSVVEELENNEEDEEEDKDKEEDDEEEEDKEEDKDREDDEIVEIVAKKSKIDAMARILSKQFFWTSVATASFVFGVGFLVLSREVVQHDFKTRRWSRRTG